MNADTATRAPFVRTWESDDGGPPVIYHALHSRPGWPGDHEAHHGLIVDYRPCPEFTEDVGAAFAWNAESMADHHGRTAEARGYCGTFAEALSNVLTVWACGPDQEAAWPVEDIPRRTFSERMTAGV